MRTPILLSIISGITLLTACDDQSDSADCRYYVQQDLDNAQFEDAINRLSSESCQNSYSDNEYLVDLGSAYLGNSGYTLTSILSAVLAEDEESDAFVAFSTEIAENKNSDSYSNLELAASTFSEFLGSECSDLTDMSSTETSICLVQGAIDLTEAALAIDYLSGDIESWADDTSDTMLQATCALQYAVETADGTSVTLPYFCDTDIEVTVSEEVTFNSESFSKTLNHLTVTGTEDTEYYLQSTDTGDLVFTTNYCETDFTVCSDINEASCYVCPSESETDESVNDFVLTALNEGLDNIESIVADLVDDEDSSDIQEAIDEFKAEIGTCDTSAEACYTMDDIINYLNN